MTNNRWNRRTFFKSTLAGALVIFGTNNSFARLLDAKRYPEGQLNLLNTHSKERLSITFRNTQGEYDPEAITAINRLLRCHYTNEVAAIDIRVIEYLNQVDKELGGGNEIQIISGYRSPAYNGLLRSEGRHVAKHSLHMEGKAIDFALPHVGLEKVRRTALTLHNGGVGYYPGAGFVHIDSGSFRTW